MTFIAVGQQAALPAHIVLERANLQIIDGTGWKSFFNGTRRVADADNVFLGKAQR